jgi:hypothetical protein
MNAKFCQGLILLVPVSISLIVPEVVSISCIRATLQAGWVMYLSTGGDICKGP